MNLIYTESFIRTRDKYGFVFGILNIMLTSFLLGFNPILYLKYYSVKYTSLILIRTCRYYHKKWYLYLVDFCYYSNLITLAFLHYYAPNSRCFNVVFMFSFGPLIFAIPIFRNSLVLHSLDRITSTVLHFSAPLACYVVKWMDYDDVFG